MIMNFQILYRTFCCTLLILLTNNVAAERIKDMTSISGVRDNQLVGYGVVVGLDGTGDKTNSAPFTAQSVKSMLNQLGVTIPSNVNPQLKNVAAVMLHATLPPFSKPGQKIDVTVSSLGDSKSLRGRQSVNGTFKGCRWTGLCNFTRQSCGWWLWCRII